MMIGYLFGQPFEGVPAGLDSHATLPRTSHRDGGWTMTSTQSIMLLRWAFPLPVLLRLPRPWCVAARRCQQGAVSGFPLLCLKSCRPSPVAAPV